MADTENERFRRFTARGPDHRPEPHGPPNLLPAPSVPLDLLDPPETDSQRNRPLPGGDLPDSHPDPDLLLDREHVNSDPLYQPGVALTIAAVKHALADRDTPIVKPHRLSVDFRHSGWMHNRLLVYRALHRTDQPVSRKSAFAHCGAEAYVLQSVENPGVFRIAGSSCHDRFCLPCARERSQAIALNVLELTANRHLRFLTLTLKASDEPLAAQLDKLYNAFQHLRRRKIWNQKVKGGVAFLEVTWSEATATWHPHFHILIEGTYLPQQVIKKLWYAITGDSFVVDIRAVRDLRTAAQYVTKYASKPFNNTFLNRESLLDEAIVTFKGRKLLLTFGTWRGITLVETPSEGAWDHVAPLETIITQAAHGDADARAIMTALTDADLGRLYRRAPPEPPPTVKPEPPVSQLTFFAVWTANDHFIYPGFSQRTIS